MRKKTGAAPFSCGRWTPHRSSARKRRIGTAWPVVCMIHMTGLVCGFRFAAIDPKLAFLAERAAQMSARHGHLRPQETARARHGHLRPQETLTSSVPTRTLKSSVPREGSTGVAQQVLVVDKTEEQDSSNTDSSFLQLKMVDDPPLTLEEGDDKGDDKEASSSSSGGGPPLPEPAWDPGFGYKVCRGDKWEDFKVNEAQKFTRTPEGEKTPISVPVGDGEDGHGERPGML